MENPINNIYKQNIELIENINMSINSFRTQNFDSALRFSAKVINQLNQQVELLFKEEAYFNIDTVLFSRENLIDMLKGILEAQSNRDYILLADLYELQLYPFIISIQEFIVQNQDIYISTVACDETINLIKNKNNQLFNQLQEVPGLDELCALGYTVEATSCGLMTLALFDHDKKYYLHSNGNIFSESVQLANSWYSNGKSKYVIYGLGLGYHIFELYKIDNSINIEIYESDINIIWLACAYSDLKIIFSCPNINLIYDPDMNKLNNSLNKMDKSTEFVIHYPSVRNIRNLEIRKKMENYFIQYSSIKNQIKQMQNNFAENIQHFDELVDKLKPFFCGKDLYIIAAGPSLDKNYLDLKKVRGNSIILSTGTVFRKLIAAGIVPDYVIITDSNPRIFAQIKDLEDCEIPLIILSTAYKEFAKKYRGRKYIILQKDFYEAEEFAGRTGGHLYQTGGSVSTTALDIAINFGCRRIIFLGLDLAFTDNFVHAENTSRRFLANTDDLYEAEDIYGKKILTSRILNIYREWIEKRIQGVEGIEFIDATEGGAKIKGMKVCKLSDYLIK